MDKIKEMSMYNQGSLAAGVLAIIFSFLPSYVTVSMLGFSEGVNAWHSFATLGVLLIIAATALIAVKALAAESLPAEVPWYMIATAAAGLGTFLVLIRGVTVSHASMGWSGWVTVIFALVLTAGAAMSMVESGEKLPQANKEA